ncbi:ABC transporter permease [Janibacter cremeus]|uniref:ABC transporter permease n=1 Tax=Janibacter cremeus TaxID=1285192 RepID=UPI0023F933FB|nr:ABC transporter permease [Janibacter cremeus]WEV78067.1 ABC transporter permease [Janibacter cremeus]
MTDKKTRTAPETPQPERETPGAEPVSSSGVSADGRPVVDDDQVVARSLSADAFRSLKRNPLFWVSSVLVLMFLLMAAWPSLFTNQDPHYGVLSRAMQSPSTEHWFGTDRQGYDIYSRVVYGARASILVGVFAASGALVLGSIMGLLAGYVSGWADALVSRVADIFFAIPLLLAGIIFLAAMREEDTIFGVPIQGYFGVIFQVVLVLVIFGWPSIMRLMRSSVLQVKPNDYVQAARALGASPMRITRRHILPNAMAPVIAVSTINLGAYISVEATLSYLGIGLRPPTVSWGVMITDAQIALRTEPYILFFPALFLSLAVLAFIMLGDSVRDAFDPKSR